MNRKCPVFLLAAILCLLCALPGGGSAARAAAADTGSKVSATGSAKALESSAARREPALPEVILPSKGKNGASAKVRLNKTYLMLKKGAEKRLRLKHAADEVSWRSTDSSVASVDEDGYVLARSAGTCTIVAKSGGKRYRCSVVVCRDRKAYKFSRLQEVHKADKNQNRILAAGSSSIERWTGLEDAFAPYDVINMGISGSTVQQWLKWYRKLIVKYNPRAVILYPGVGNALAKGRSVKRVLSDTRGLLEELHEALPKVPIFYVSIFHNLKRPDLWEMEDRCNEEIEEYCGGLKNVHYIDVAGGLSRDGDPLPGVIGDDNVHLSSRGYRIWNRTIVPAVKEKIK